MFKNIISYLMNNVLADFIGYFYLDTEAECRIQRNKECKTGIHCNGFHILIGNRYVHDLLEKFRYHHYQGGG